MAGRTPWRFRGVIATPESGVHQPGGIPRRRGLQLKTTPPKRRFRSIRRPVTGAPLLPVGAVESPAFRSPGGHLMTGVVLAAAAVIMAIGAARIRATHGVLSNTYDEPVHVAGGMELLDRGTHTYEFLHPPFARVVAAVGPWLIGARSTGSWNQWLEGSAVLNSGRGYRDNLNAARLAVLPFFLVACVMVFAWARTLAGSTGALAALLVFSLTPPVLAHGGLATTDMAATGGVVASVLALARWLEDPVSWRRSLLLGAALALAVGSKFSPVAFLAVTLALMLGVRAAGRDRAPGDGAGTPRVPAAVLLGRLATAAAVTGLLLFASYGFDTGRVRGIPLPMPDLVRGLRFLVLQNEAGRGAFLMGQTYLGGRLAFFPALLAVKTPLPVLLLSMAGVVVVLGRWRRTRRGAWLDPLVLTIAVLGVAMASNLNLGVRHVLPVYGAMAVLSGIAVEAALATVRRGAAIAARLSIAVALSWLAWNATRAHPDYLAWFNELAGDEPGAIAVDSDLDWGQDLDRLADTVRARGITSLTLAYYGSSDHVDSLFPGARRLSHGDPQPRAEGWFAISETLYRRGTAAVVDDRWTLYPEAYAWLRAEVPVTRVGRSIRLYHLPPLPGSDDTPPDAAVRGRP